ncbi:MAG: ATP-dependent helicase HrpB [Candidatus Marinimicrobia bacterium]|nr:ATP-dependent helicase HrpB [Candidatus Neomarinimicrobiota bacterium]
MDALPIGELAAPLAAAWGAASRLLLTAPTGSGKSTQIPQFLLDAGLAPAGQIVVLQPRRLAARMLARRVARERGVALGSAVGYQVRDEHVAGPHTRICYVTEGVLLRRLLSDPDLRDVAAILFDEFHERHLPGDLMLGLARALQARRPELKLLVMSATLDVSGVADYLAPAPLLQPAGRCHPVAIQYLERAAAGGRAPIWETAARALPALLAGVPEGDLLVFMPGAYEIQRTIEAFRGVGAARGFEVLPLHGRLSAADQDRAVSPGARRRIIVATNIAETSITIAGVRGVLDSGLAREAGFDPRRGIETLLVAPISRAAAEQRSGRAGRTAPGVALRLWTAREHEQRPAYTRPEIQRVDLAEPLLALKALGFARSTDFPWFEPPPPAALEQAEALLRDLAATDAAGRITSLGRQLLRFPLHPRYARLLLAAAETGCLPEATRIAALTQTRPLLPPARDPAVREARGALTDEPVPGDYALTLRGWAAATAQRYAPAFCQAIGLQAEAAREADRLAARFQVIARSAGLALDTPPATAAQIGRALLAAFPDRVARRCDQGSLRCELVHGRRGELARSSAVHHAPLLLVGEITELDDRHGGVRTLLSQATALETEWLAEARPDALRDEKEYRYDPRQKRVLLHLRRCFLDLVLRDQIRQDVTAAEAAPVLAQALASGALESAQWPEAITPWLARLESLAAWCPDWRLPTFDASARQTVLGAFCVGAVGARDLKDRKLLPCFRVWLGAAAVTVLEREAPTHFTLPSGRRRPIVYCPPQPPRLAATIQDLDGLQTTPRIAGRRMPLTIEILAPNQRPVQTTTDLDSFWRTAYPALRPALSRRYPKHRWP